MNHASNILNSNRVHIKKKYIPHKTRKKQTEHLHKLTFKEKKALEKVHDKELNEALEKFLIKCYQVKKL